jgi:cytochrome oxidase Cu insertion factor (SCO1/SenC/PrrC family)
MQRTKLTFCLILLAMHAGCDPVKEKTSTPPPVPSSIAPRTPKLSSFDLTDQDGKPYSSKSLAGKPWVGSFFFTQCPAICWRMNQALAKWQQDHPESKFQFVSITCDPARDTPEALTLYAKHFKADPKRWVFLTGDMNYITKVGQDMFMLAVQPETHSSRAVIFDRKGDIRGSFEVTNPDDLARFEKMLKEVEAEE